MKVILIRHGMTEGNKYRKYIGVTDEPLCQEGIEALREKYTGSSKCSGNSSEEKTVTECAAIGKVAATKEIDSSNIKLFVSPLLRCRETAEIIFPGVKQEVVPELAEMDFGIFENRAFTEDLEFLPEYQAWLDTMCEGPVPGGESKEIFTQRCKKGFMKALEEVKDGEVAAFVVHGGTIMSIMSEVAIPEKLYYEWGVKNGEGYVGDWDGQHIIDAQLI